MLFYESYKMIAMQAQDDNRVILEILWDLMTEVEQLNGKLRDAEVTEHNSPILTDLTKQRDGTLKRIEEQHVVLQRKGLGPPFYTYFLHTKPTVVSATTHEATLLSASHHSAGDTF